MHTIKMRIRGAEFEASGDEATVSAQFAAFMKLVESLPTTKSDSEAGADQAGDTESGASKGPGSELEELCNRTFSADAEIVSLNALPQGDGATLDAIALLLFGFHRLKGKATVMIGEVLEALRQSGVPDTNVARVVAGHPGLVTKAGIKRGTRYGLTNRGRAHALEVLQNLL